MSENQGKLKASEVAGYRDAMLAQQQGLCALCGKSIDSDPVLDHDHKTGRLRGVLHRSCNRAEGVAKNALRWASSPPDFLRRVADYMERDWGTRPFHPSHKTEQDKRVRLLRKRLKAANTMTGKRKIQHQINLIVQSSAYKS